jgi:hypothetical protein
MSGSAQTSRQGSNRWRTCALLGLAALAGAAPAAPQAPRVSVPVPKGKGASPVAGIPVATLVYAEKVVEKEADPDKGWKKLQEGERFRTGDRVRVGLDALARFEFPWMSLTAGPVTTLRIPAERILSAVLDEGRAELLAPGARIVKVRAAEAEIRGEGRVVVRRDKERGLVVVMAMEGTFRVEAKEKAVVLRAGEGVEIVDGEVPREVIALPPPPGGIFPGPDPVYVKKGQDVRLSWSPAGTAHHVQILPINSADALIARDVGPAPYSMTIPWLGTYRWRVSSRDERGLEGVPSPFGYICVVEK